MNRGPSFSWLRSLARKLARWMGSTRLAVATWQHHTGWLDGKAEFTLDLPALPPLPASWRPVLQASRARLVQGEPFKLLATVTARGACICAILEDCSEQKRPALLLVRGSDGCGASACNTKEGFDDAQTRR